MGLRKKLRSSHSLLPQALLPLLVQEGSGLQGPLVALLLLVASSPWSSPAPRHLLSLPPMGQGHCFPAVTAQGESFCLGELLQGEVNDFYPRPQKERKIDSHMLLLLLLSHFSHVQLCVTP